MGTALVFLGVIGSEERTFGAIFKNPASVFGCFYVECAQRHLKWERWHDAEKAHKATARQERKTKLIPNKIAELSAKRNTSQSNGWSMCCSCVDIWLWMNECFFCFEEKPVLNVCFSRCVSCCSLLAWDWFRCATPMSCKICRCWIKPSSSTARNWPISSRFWEPLDVQPMFVGN